MRYFVGVILALAFGVVGCSYDCSAMGCFDSVHVVLEPEVGTTYDVELVLDGDVGAFTCTEFDGRWSPTDVAGSVPLSWCEAHGFDLVGSDPLWEVPSSVEISVEAQDGSWTGSVNASPNYEFFQPNGAKCDGAYGCDRATLTVPKQ